MKSYVPLLKCLLIIIVIDVIVLGVFNWYLQPEPSLSIAEILIIPVIIFVNLLIALYAHLRRNKTLRNAILINTVIASLIFHQLFNLMIKYYLDEHYKSYYFKFNAKLYELCLSKTDTTYSFIELHNGSSISWTSKPYKIRHDSILLTDSSKHYLVYKNKLFNYPETGSVINLSDKR